MRPWASDAELLALVDGYVADVLSGRRIVGRLERLAVERHVRDLEAVASGARPDWRFDAEEGLDVLRFAVSCVRHTKGRWSGQRFTFDSRSAWSAWTMFVLFGWQRRVDGAWERRFNEVFLTMARKNGKTMIAAIIALYMFFLQGEGGAEVYCGATQLRQAAIAWKQAAAIVRREPSLARRVTITAGQKGPYVIAKIDDLEASFEALSRNDHEFDGLNPYVFVGDEIHAWPDSGLYDVMRSGQGARRSPLRLLITTRGANPESFCGAHERALINVLEGTAEDDTTFALICTLDEGDDWKDPRVWPKANPNIGVTVSVDRLRAELQSALNDSGKLAEFLRKYMNLWTRGAKAWLPLSVWDTCAGPVDLEALAGAPCVVTVDLSKSNDFTAAAVTFPLAGGRFACAWHFWLPEAVVDERATTARVPIRSWVAEGLVTLTPGPIVEQDAVKDWILEQRARYDVREVMFDEAQAWKLAGELSSEGVDNVVFWPQAWAKNHAALKEAEDALQTGAVDHGGNKVARWMFRNVAVRETASGLRRIDKAKSADKVDGMTTFVMGIARAMHVDPPSAFYVGAV